MSRLRSLYVCENALYEYSKKLKLDKYLRLGKGEETTGGRQRKALLADVFEAFLAAVYLTYDMKKVKEIVYDVVIKAIENEENYYLNDYKSKLQELLQTDKRSLEYILESEEGPSNDKIFTSIAVIDGVILGRGTSTSKKESEQEAAKDALSRQANIYKDSD